MAIRRWRPEVVFLSAIFVGAVGCVLPHDAVAPAPERLPFSRPPTFMGARQVAAKAGHYQVTLETAIMRDVIPADSLAFVVRARGTEVARYPIVANVEHAPGTGEASETKISQPIDLARGDYEVVLDYHGHLYGGAMVKIADVPFWGGHHEVAMFVHRGTRVSPADDTISIGRWWANDTPTAPWLIEWRRAGHAVTTTSGREQPSHEVDAFNFAARAADAETKPQYAGTLWSYGEQHALPAEVKAQPGAWEAWAVRSGASAVAIAFTILPDGKVANPSDRKIRHDGWGDGESQELATRNLTDDDAAPLVAQLDAIGGAQALRNGKSPRAFVDVVPMTPSAARALFRSTKLAKLWHTFNELNQSAIGIVTYEFSQEQQDNLSRGQMRAISDAAQDDETSRGKAENAVRTAKVRALRPQILKLIEANGGPWTRAEQPKT